MGETTGGLSHSTDAAEEGDAPPDLPFDPGVVEDLIRSLLKVVRAHQLYMHNNPMYQKALDNCRAFFLPVWELTDELTLEVTDTQLKWCGHPVLSEVEKASDSLAWLLYKDGIRELQLLRGFEEEEIVSFLDIIQKVRRAAPDDDDLIVMFWERDFTSLRYKYIELLPDGLTGIERPIVEDRRIEVDHASATVATGGVPGIVSMSDFDSTLYFLDSGEIAYLQSEIEKEYKSDLPRICTATLLDIFEVQNDPAVRDEIMELLDYLVVHLLVSRDLSTLSFLLRESEMAGQRVTGLTQAQKERLDNLADRLSDEEPLGQLLQVLEDSPSLPQKEHLESLALELRSRALPTLLRWITISRNAELRLLLESAADRLAAANTAELVRLIASEEPEVRLEAMRRAGSLRTAAAVPNLARATADADASIRLAAVKALDAIGSPGALQVLEKRLADDDREIRIAVLRSIGTRNYRQALGRIEELLKGRSIREAELSEKVAAYETYGTLAGESGVQYLDGILNGKGLFGKKEDVEVRACAALALGRIGSDRALAVLQKASGEKDIVVRSSINKALRGGAA